MAIMDMHASSLVQYTKVNSHPQERSRFPQVHLHLDPWMQMDLRCHWASQLVVTEMAGWALVNQRAYMM